MIYLYIGAAVVVGLLIGFVALSVKLVAQRVSAGIRERAAELLSTYDRLIEKKSKDLERLTNEIDEKTLELAELTKEPVTAAAAEEENREPGDASYVLNVAEMMGSAKYQDPRTGSLYQKIRANFNHDPLKTIREIAPDAGEKGPATRILEQLSYESVYKLSALPEDEQIEILRECLDVKGQDLLDDYVWRAKKFQAIQFYDHLMTMAQTEPQKVVLKVSPMQELPVMPSGVEVQVDGDICEGFIVEANNKLYDYCVRKSEIS